MPWAHYIAVFTLSLLLVEGFILSVFPSQFRDFLIETDPRSLQVAGLIETVVVAGLLAGLLLQ
jgi:hypothetical protein